MAFKQHSKEDVKSKRTLWVKDGKRKAGVAIEFQDGEKVVLLNPSGKGGKFAKELKEGKHYTNDGKVKKDDKGNNKRLTDNQRSYRSGYLSCLKDQAKIHNAKKKGGEQ